MAPAYRIMGIVNVTPDSFSDAGEWFERDAAIAHGRRLVEEGAAILDIGGESTRPYSEPVPEEEELARVLPVVEALADAPAQLSVDTMKLGVARRAIDAGATYINDVTAFRHEPGLAALVAERGCDCCLMHMLGVARRAIDAGATYINDVTAFRHEPGLAALVAERGCDCCLMHMLGEPRTMQIDPRYEDVVGEVRAFLEERAAFALGEGIAAERIMVDPGIGFGKTVAHNLELLRRLAEIADLGFPVVIGTSRKAFLGKLAGREDPHERVAGTVATNVLALERGATVFRVHDVAPTADALAVAAATLRADGA